MKLPIAFQFKLNLNLASSESIFLQELPCYKLFGLTYAFL